MFDKSERQLRRKARRLMANRASEYDNCTFLAEAIAHELDHDEWLDEETHWIWGFAVDYSDIE